MKTVDAARRMLATRTVSTYHQRQLLLHVRDFTARHGPFLDALCDEKANAWIDSLVASGRAPKTIKAYRASLLNVWRYAWEEGHVECPPRRIKRVRVPRVPPTAWTRDEIRALLAACDRLKRRSRRAWARCYIHLVWSTGLRKDDLFAIQVDAISPMGTSNLAQHKTADGHTVTLSVAALAALRGVGGQLPPRSREAISRLFRELVALSGVRPGTARWLRRSAASYVERDRPGHGARFLGHRTPGMAERHYFDPGITGTANEPPPPL